MSLPERVFERAAAGAHQRGGAVLGAAGKVVLARLDVAVAVQIVRVAGQELRLRLRSEVLAVVEVALVRPLRPSFARLL